MRRVSSFRICLSESIYLFLLDKSSDWKVIEWTKVRDIEICNCAKILVKIARRFKSNLSLKLFNSWSIIDFDKSIRNHCELQLWRVWLKIIKKLIEFKFRLFEINLLESLWCWFFAIRSQMSWKNWNWENFAYS